MTNDELAGFHRRYNACCNEHRFDDSAEFVAREAAIDGTPRGLDAYAAELQTAVRFLGAEATGRSVAVPEFAFYRVDAGRIAEVWGSAFTCICSNSSGISRTRRGRARSAQRRRHSSPSSRGRPSSSG